MSYAARQPQPKPNTGPLRPDEILPEWPGVPATASQLGPLIAQRAAEIEKQKDRAHARR